MISTTPVGCDVQASCGGCPQLQLDRVDELTGKVKSVASALKTAGIEQGVQQGIALESGSSQNRFGYRNRLRMKVLDGRADFFNQAKRDGCPVVRPDLWAAIQHLRSVTAQDPALLVGVDHLEVRVGDREEPECNNIVGLSLSSAVDLGRLVMALGSGWIGDWRVADPSVETPPALSYLVAQDVFVDVPVTSFVQVNSDVNQRLVASVLDVAAGSAASTFLDLFSGAGNFAVPLVARGLRGTAVESAGDAVWALERSAAATSGALRCTVGDARSILPELQRCDLVVADPPRAGLQQNYDHLASLTGTALVLIGCSATSFARDVAALVDAGMRLESVEVFDMFPGTNHVEALGVLRPAP